MFNPKGQIVKKFLWLILCFVALPAVGAALDGTEILKKVDRNLEPESYEAYRQLIDIQPDGSKRESVLYTMKKGRDKVVALFLAPPSDKGRVTLRDGDNMWLYMPDVGRAIRITSLQSVTGSVFNNSSGEWRFRSPPPPSFAAESARLRWRCSRPCRPVRICFRARL